MKALSVVALVLSFSLCACEKEKSPLAQVQMLVNGSIWKSNVVKLERGGDFSIVATTGNKNMPNHEEVKFPLPSLEIGRYSFSNKKEYSLNWQTSYFTLSKVQIAYQNNQTQVSWITANESNIYHWQLEYSYDGNIYYSTNSILANNTAGPNHYSKHTFGGSARKLYYRLLVYITGTGPIYSPIIEYNPGTIPYYKLRSIIHYFNETEDTITNYVRITTNDKTNRKISGEFAFEVQNAFSGVSNKVKITNGKFLNIPY